MRIAKRVLPFLVLLLVPLAAASCRSILKEAFKPPKVRVADILLTSNPIDDPKEPWAFILTLAVNNPNSYPLNVSHVAYAAVIGRETVAEGDHRSEIRVEASQVTTISVPLTVRPEAFRDAMRQVMHARHLEYEFNGSVALHAPVVGVVRIPFSRTGTVDPVDLLRKKGFGIN